MKLASTLIFVVALSIGLGIAAGAITANVRVVKMEERLQMYRIVNLDDDRKDRKSEITDQTGTPRFEMVNGEVHEFGTMEKNEEFEHTFVIKNTGDADGIVKLIQTSCKCTMSKKMGEDVLLKPGEEESITLSWKPVNYNEEFEQTAKIQTEDPDREIIELRIKGRVIQRVRPVPPAMYVSGLATDKESQHSLRLYSYRNKDMQILSTKFTMNKELDKFDVETRSLNDEELATEKGAVAGELITITTKAGMPYGPTDQELLLETNLEGEDGEIKIPIKVIPKSEITIKGGGRKYRFLDLHSRVEFGVVSKRSPAETTLSIYVRHNEDTPEDIEMKVLENETFPANGIIAEFQQPQRLPNLTIFPLKISIADDQKPIVLAGEDGKDIGSISIESNLKSAKRIEIFVQYTFIE